MTDAAWAEWLEQELTWVTTGFAELVTYLTKHLAFLEFLDHQDA